MPANAPDYITDPKERQLYRDLSRVFEDYCGDDSSKFSEREDSFLKTLNLVAKTLQSRVAACR